MKKKIFLYLLTILIFSIMLGIAKYYVDIIFKNNYLGGRTYSFWLIPIALITVFFSYKFLPSNRRKIITIIIWVIAVWITNFTCHIMNVINNSGAGLFMYGDTVLASCIMETFDRIIQGIRLNAYPSKSISYIISGVVNLIMYIVSIIICITLGKNKYNVKEDYKKYLIDDISKKRVALYLIIIFISSIALGIISYYINNSLINIKKDAYYLFEVIPLALIVGFITNRFVSKDRRIIIVIVLWLLSIWISSISYNMTFYIDHNIVEDLVISRLTFIAPFLDGIVTQIGFGISKQINRYIIAGVSNIGIVFVSLAICIILARCKNKTIMKEEK